MLAAGVADEYCPALYAMAWPAVGGTPVNSVLVIEAAACRVKLDQLVAHLGRPWGWFELLYVAAGVKDRCQETRRQ